MPHHLTLAQAASLLSCSEVRVLELVDQGYLSMISAGIPLAQVAELLASGIPESGLQAPSPKA